MKNDLLTIGGFTIHGYGLMIGLGIIAAYWMAERRAEKKGLDSEVLVSIGIWGVAAGLLGAKLLYYITVFDEILADPKKLLDLGDGFVVYGGIIGGVLGGYVLSRVKRLPFLRYADLVMPSVALAQGFGRIGCFLAGCCYGAPCDSPLSVVYPEGVSAPAGVPLLPTQLFEAAFCFLYTAVLVCIFFRQKRYGTTTGWYFVGYGVWRFIIEFFRSDDRGAVGALSTSQFIGIFIVLAGAALLLLVRRGKTPAHIPPQPGADAADTDAEPERPVEPQPEDAAAEAARDDGGPEPGSSAVDVDAGPERPDDAPEQDAPPCG